jgi:acyl dehydratase
MTTTNNPIDTLRERIGVQRGPSDWRSITQENIDSFAEISGDHQWIHVDRERAERESPFGTTIAHGNLTLCVIDGLREQLGGGIADDQVKLGVNMGWNKVRYPAPVPADSRVRATAELVTVTDKGGGWWELVDRFTVEVEGSEKPAVVAESVVRLLVAD